MAQVIRSGDRASRPQGAAFNFEDLAQGADAYLAGVRERAARIVLEASRQADELRKNAEIEAKRAAEQAVEALVAKRVAQQVQTLLPALGKAVDQIEQSRGAWLTYWEKRACQLAAAMAERVVRRELAHEPKIALDLLREALDLSSRQAALRVRLNPQDHAALAESAQVLCQELARTGPATIVADAAISPGGCRVESPLGAVDQQIEAQLARLVEELT